MSLLHNLRNFDFLFTDVKLCKYRTEKIDELMVRLETDNTLNNIQAFNIQKEIESHRKLNDQNNCNFWLKFENFVKK